MGKYHPHGDDAIYDALVRMAQDWSLRVPLIDGQGNFGSIDGDMPAAMRYTEVRMEKVTGTIRCSTTSTRTRSTSATTTTAREEPVGRAGEVPEPAGQRRRRHRRRHGDQHSAAQSRRGHQRLLALIDNPAIELLDLMQIMPGPDFPTGGIILGRAGIRQAYSTGRGSILMRGRVHIEEMRGDREAIIITEIPFQVNKATMIEKMAELVRDKRIEGISDIRDEIRPRRLSASSSS
jgi:DNA gyrase subunit A